MSEATPATNNQESTPYQSFVKDLKGYLETAGARMDIILGLEDRSGTLAGIEGVKFLAGISKKTDDLLSKSFPKKKKFPGFQQAIEDLTGKPADKAVFEGLRDMLNPWFQEFEALKPEIEAQVKTNQGPTGDYPLEKIIPEKIVFALMLLVQEQSEKVKMLPEGMRANGEKMKAVLAKTRKGFKDPERWKNNGWKAVTYSVVAAVGLTAIATGVIVGGAWVLYNNETIASLIEGLPVVREGVQNQAREERYQQYTNKLNELRQGWRSEVRADNLLGFLDPKQWPEGNSWQAFVEFCGPECLLDTSLIPLEGKEVIMDMLQINESQYVRYQQHPDELSAHLRIVYPDKLWLAELFAINKTDVNSPEMSDYERWQEKWQEQGSVAPSVGLLGVSMIGGALGRQVRLDRRRDLGRIFGRGRGSRQGRFGSTKGLA